MDAKIQSSTPSFTMTIDVEDYFHVSAFENDIKPSDWNGLNCRVTGNVHRIVESLSRFDTKATFFVLGWVAERYPDLVRQLHSYGHEIASHGYNHQRLTNLSRVTIREDLRSAKALLEDIIGDNVIGYRAPSFSFDESKPWIQDELLEAGYSYSSSINPVPHDFYGYKSAPRTPFTWPNGLVEIPVATYAIGKKRIPCAGGGFFRLYPYWLFKQLLINASKQLAGPVVFYIHPWEIDADQPRIQTANLKSRLRHYINLHKTHPRLERLLAEFDWCRMRDLDVVKKSKEVIPPKN